MIVKWICSTCGLLNNIDEKECKNCKAIKFKTAGIVHFTDIEHMKNWIKAMKDYMGAKVWWSP